MKPKKVPIERLKQESVNPMSDWATVQKNWVLQLLLRLCEKTWDQSILGSPPPYFDITKLSPPISLAQIVYFDEIHRQVYIGTSNEFKIDIRLV